MSPIFVLILAAMIAVTPAKQLHKRGKNVPFSFYRLNNIRLYHTATILSPENKKALFYHPKPRSHENESEAWGAETKLF